MTTKEKAQEILDSFIQLNYQHSVDTKEEHGMSHEYHKKCAKIHVNGILKALEEYDDRTEKYLKQEFNLDYQSVELQNMDSSFRYWEKFKKELELL